VPGGNYWWMWRYANALDFVSYGRIKYTDTFLLYIIALNLVFIGTPFFRILTSFNGTPSLHAVIIVAIILFVVLLITSIITLAFFCATIQDKISKLPKNPTI
jgi:predicted PurR-regulated permease PerM